MNSKKTLFPSLYEAPACEFVASDPGCICADSYGSTTDDFTDGGDFDW